MTARSLWLVACAATCSIIVAGCDESAHKSAEPPVADDMVRPAAAFAGESDTTKAGGAARFATMTAAGLNRKIIYSATIDIVVESFGSITDDVVALAKRFDAYIADSRLSGASGTNRSGTWKIRVPIARFEEFVNQAKDLGELRSAATESQDVSEEYYDVDARIRNKTKEEERLLKLLEEHPGKLQEVITIERELSRVHEELERMQGRLRVLADLTTMTTVNLVITEIRNYEPPRAPSFATRVRRAFEGSIESLQSTGEEAVVAAAALAPWLTVLGICAVPCYGIAHRLRRRGRNVAQPPPGVSGQ
jgi:hypothetical protein